MKKIINTWGNKMLAARVAIAMMLVTFGQNTLAALPATAAPTRGAAAGDYIGLMQGYAFDIGIVFGLVVGTLGFLVVAKNMIGVYAEIGAGKKTWGDMGMNAGMGVLLLVFIVFLLTEAAGVL